MKGCQVYTLTAFYVQLDLLGLKRSPPKLLFMCSF